MIQIASRSYKDHLGRTITGGMPIGNQADKGTYKTTYSVYTGFIISESTPLQFVQGIPGQIIMMGGDGWASTGIVAGDTVTISATNYEGDTTMSGTSLVQVVDGDTLTVSGIVANMMASSGRIFINKPLQAVEVDFNLVPSDVDSNVNSFIDNSIVRLSNNNITSLAVNATMPLQQVGTKSGGIIKNATIKRIGDGTMSGGIVTKRYEIEVEFVWWGYLSMFGADYFQDGLTITPLERVSFFPLFNNPASALTTYFKPENDGNSGYRNENFNQNSSLFTVNSCVWKDDNNNVMSNYDYSKNSNFEIKLATSAGFGTNFGLIFFNDIQDAELITSTIDNTIGQFSHDRLTLLGEKSNLTATTGQSLTSATGRNGEQYSITNIDISISGSVATIKGKIQPNQAFIDYFMDEDNVNKRFALLVRSEGSALPATNYSTTVNSLAWIGEGEVAPVILTGYPMTIEMFDHTDNSVTKDYEVIIEDDIRVRNIMRFDRFANHTKVRFSPIAQNIVTQEWFPLETYDFAITAPILPDGSQDIAVSIPTYFSQFFPESCPNISMSIGRLPSQDTMTQYGIDMIFGLLIRWEAWIQQLNANIDFYGNSTKDWRQYQAGNWRLAFMTETTVENLGTYRNLSNLWIEDYDHNPDLECEFKFYRLDGTPITNPLIGEVVKVRATFTEVNGFNIIKDWGMITVEPQQSAPRYVISSVYNQGVQPNNPLIPLITAGDKLFVDGWGTPTVIMECQFDPNRLNVSGGVSFTARIQGSDTQTMRHKQSFKLVQLPYNPSNQGKDGKCCDCTPELKLASVDSNELINNDIISHVHKLTDDSETVSFRILKDGVDLALHAVQWTFPNDPLAHAITFNVRDYLIHYGEGCYEVVKDITPAGISMTVSLGHYEIRHFTTESAEGTTRILYQNDFVTQFEENGVLTMINYAGSGFEDSYRFRGMFGWWKPNVSSVSNYSNVRENRMATIISKEKYTLRMFDASDCERRRLHKIVMHASLYRMSDHNWSNPDQRMIITNCILDTNATEDVEYFAGSRKMGIELQLTVRNENSVSRFGGTNQLPLGVTSVLQTIGASEVIDPNNCLPATLNVVNSLGTVVDSQTVPSGSTAIANAPNGTVTILDSLGGVLETLNVPSNVNINWTAFLGNPGVVYLRRASDSSIFNYVIVAPDTTDYVDVADSVVTLRNSDGVFLGTFDIKPETPTDIIAPDVTVYFQSESGAPMGSDFIPAGVSKIITVPDAQIEGGWHRPLWWLEQPTIGDENVVWELMTVFAGNQNPYTHNLHIIDGVTTEFYADKDDPTPFYTATANNNTLIDFDDCNPIAGQFVRQCWVKSFPTNPANDWGTVAFNTTHNVYGTYSSQVVERIVSCKSTHPLLYTNLNMGVSSAYPLMLENLEFRNKFCSMNWYEALYYTYALKRIWSENAGVITGSGSSCRGMFTQSGLQYMPINITLASDISYQCFANSRMQFALYDFASIPATQSDEFTNCQANVIIGNNMGGLTYSVGNFTYAVTYYLELHAYTLGHSLNGNAMRGEEVFTAWVDSLGSASGSQTITVSTLQFNSFGGLGSYVDNELFAKGYTLNVV